MSLTCNVQTYDITMKISQYLCSVCDKPVPKEHGLITKCKTHDIEKNFVQKYISGKPIGCSKI